MATKDRAPIDNNRRTGMFGASSLDGKTPVGVAVDPTSGAILTTQATLIGSSYDYVVASYPDAVTEVYTYKTGGSSGTTVATVTITYTDSSKMFVNTVSKA